jgi:Zn-dependent protease with chaperone function
VNFFEHQARARRRTVWYVLLFLAATAAVVVAADTVVLAVAWGIAYEFDAPVPLATWLGSHPAAVVWTSLATLGFIGGASLYRMIGLAGGGGAVARQVGGVRVHAATGDARRRQLVNVVEEMAIAAGVPVPEVYVLQDEIKINAFAAGYTPSDAAVVVTRGALDFLARDELQGVIAHEFSHILNGDMRLNTRLIGVLFGILAIGVTGRLILRGSAEVGDRAAVPGFVLGAALFAVGYAGLLLGRLIQAAVSRARERLADAAAVQFTRNPSGLAGALKKIAARGATLLNVKAEELSHMLVADGRKMFDVFFATHPPLVERIRLIEPRFDPAELKGLRLTPVTVPGEVTPAGAPAAVVAAVGKPGASALAAARARQRAMPPALTAAAHAYGDSLLTVLGLVLSRDGETRARQVAEALTRLALDPGAASRIETLAREIGALDPALRLTLSELAFPALRRRGAGELQTLATVVDALIRWDGQVTVFEYALAHLLRLQLDEVVAPRARRAPARAPKLYALRDDVQALLSILAQAGQGDGDQARAAYERGARRVFPMDTPAYAPPPDWIAAFDRALARLDALPPAIKQDLVEALARVATYAAGATTSQAELLRVVCASLHCPLPPLVASAS